MLQLDALHAEMALRGAVAGLLVAHGVALALPGPRPATRAALALFLAGVVAYLVCQQADTLLALPRVLAWVLLALCVGGTGWMWLAARALFDDGFRWSAPLLALPAGLVAVGLAANLPYFPDGDGPWRVLADDSPVPWLGRLHALLLLAFAAAALWEVLRGWRADLVQARRLARRWVATGIGVYAGVALVVELALRGQPVGRWLPALHVAGIGGIALALAVLLARRGLPEVLGTAADLPWAPGAAGPAPRGAPTADPADQAVPAVTADQPDQPPQPAGNTPPAAALPDKTARLLARLDAAMVQDHAYRSEGLTLAALAQRLDVGEAALRALINQHLGFRNFNDFLHQHRLAEATERLAQEDLPVLSIALGCGYGSIGPFNRAFRQRLGMTPTDYRAARRLYQAAGRDSA